MLVALDRGTFEKKYPYDKIARDIALHWDRIRIQLGVIELTNDPPATHKFEEMLRRWLSKQTCSKHEIYKKIYDALIDIWLFTVAKNFKKKAL